MTRNDQLPAVPPGVPQLLKVCQVSAALNMPGDTLQTWLNRGALPYVQPTGRQGKRFIKARDLAQFAQQTGLDIDWLAAM